MRIQTQPLPLDLSIYPKLDALQAGHLRHFHNLVSQLDGQWHHMGAQEPLQEFLDSYRYQLATMAYAAGASHYHRLPALRTLHKSLLRSLIHKMLRREVWNYWFTTSLSGNRTDPDRTEYRTPWADPVVRENIMYSGHLLLMTSLYTMLFDDGEFEEEGALTFTWDPIFYGFGAERFRYDRRMLQGVIVQEMERSKWIGVCCEPNNVFVVCNQFPIIAMRYNDVRDGTDVVGEVLKKYRMAWGQKGMVAENGLYVDWYYVRQDRMKMPEDVSFTAWANAFMYTWNSELVQSLYEKQRYGFITVIDGKVRLQEEKIAREYRRIVDAEGAGHDDASILARAQEKVAANLLSNNHKPLSKPTFGYVVKWLSELGKARELQGLLEYADRNLNPTWENGGLFYPRNDGRVNDSLEWTHMDPFTGNAAIGYARLNVPEGQKIMWEKPWTREDLAGRPWIDGVDLAQGVDCLRGIWDEDKGALVLTMRTWDGKRVRVNPVARNLRKGEWDVYVDGELADQASVERGDDLSVSVTVGGDEVDVVFLYMNR